MNLSRLLLPLLVLLAPGTPVVLRAAPPTRPAPVLIGAGAEAVADQERAFARLAVERGPSAAWAAFFAPDAIQLPSDQAPVHGLPAILDWVKAAGLDTPGTVLDWWPLHAQTAAGGDLGYTFGEWEFRRKDAAPDARPLAHSKFMTVWKKQPDGTWKVLVDTGNNFPEPRS